MIGLLLAFTTSVFTASALAADSTCLPAGDVSEVSRYIAFRGPYWEKGDACDAGTNSYSALKTFITLKNLKFKSSTKDLGPLNSGILGTSPWDYFTDQISYAVANPACPAGWIAAVRAREQDRMMSLCEPFFSGRQSVYQNISSLLHEAHHFTGNFAHVPCTRGQYAGHANSCDTSIREKGSYAVTVEVLAKMALFGEGISDSDRAMMKNQILLHDESFNEPILPKGFQAVYLVDDSNENAFFFDGEAIFPAPLVADAEIQVRQSMVLKIPFDRGQKIRGVEVFSPKFNLSPPDGGLALHYNTLEPEQRPAVLQITNGLRAVGALFGRDVYLTFLADQTPRKLSVDFDPSMLVWGEEIGQDPNRAYLLAADGNFFRLGPAPDQSLSLTKEENFLSGYRAVAKLGTKQLYLSNDGRLIQRLGRGAFEEVELARGKTFSRMSKPFAWTEFLYD